MAWLKFFVLFLTLPAALAAPTVVNTGRTPSSSIQEENLERSFQMLMSSQAPTTDFLNYLGRLKRIYFRVEAGIEKFDRELDDSLLKSQAYPLEKSPTYKRLLSLWDLKHRLHHKIEYHYRKLIEIRYNKNAPARDRDIAKKVVVGFHKELSSGKVVDRLVYEDLKQNLRKIVWEVASENVPLKSGFRSSEEETQALRDNRSMIRKMGKEEELKNDEISKDLEATYRLLEVTGIERDPQGAVLFPSTGQNGNIVGKVFPRGAWALTYDDGPHAVHTPAILENLKNAGIKATFFWLAKNVISLPEVVEQAKTLGMPLANHSYTHANLPKLNDAALLKEIVESTQVQRNAYGQDIRFFRCPYGAGVSVQKIREIIARNNMIHVFWNVDTLDWQDKDPLSILNRAKKQMQTEGRGVILFHDIHAQSVTASKLLVEWGKTQNGLRWVSLPEIVDEVNGEKTE